MASLDPTERAKIQLAAGDQVRISTTGQCTVQGLTGAPSSTTTLTANSQDFGPYGVSAVLLVTGVSGRTDYGLNNATYELTAPEKRSFDALVSDARITTWANRAALVTLGLTSAFFTDVGVGGGSWWYYSGGRWRPTGGRVVLKNLTTDISNNGAPKIVMDYATLLAGLVQDGDRLRMRFTKERTGGTGDTDATDVMLGAAPTTLGTSLNLTTSGLATTALQLAAEWEWRRVSATSLRTALVPGATGFGTSTSPSSIITGLTNMDTTDSYLQLTSDLTTAGGEVVWLRGFLVELIAGA